MKAVTYSKYGAPEVLKVSELPQPVPKEDEVLIRVRAAEATKADCEMRSFRYSVKWFWLPLRLALGVRAPKRQVLGSYFSGVIEACGKGVHGFAPGDEVFGSAQLRLGAYAEHMTLPARYTIVPKPANMTFAEAAAVPLGGLNALHFMRLAKIQPGEKVLINGGGGAIGAYAVQIAKSMGAEVTAVDAGVKKAGVVRLGADRFIDYQQVDFTKVGEPYDVIFDMVPGTSYRGCMRALKAKGRYLAGNPRLSLMLRSTWARLIHGKTVRVALARETKEELLALKGLIEAGQIGSIVDTVMPIEQAAEAHRRVEREERVGAIVLDIGGATA